MRAFCTLAGVALLAGCTLPTPAYRKVDLASPAFAAAVVRETQQLEAEGKSPEEARQSAPELVTRDLQAAERQHRLERAAPLVQALLAFEQPRGCWAYVATVTTHHNGKATVRVERFDPSQPDESWWTLVSQDGHAPTAKEQSAFRSQKLQQQQGSRHHRAPQESARIQQEAVFADFVSTPAAPGIPASFAFTQEPIEAPLLGRVPGSRTRYLLKDGFSLLQRTENATNPGSMLGGSVKMDHFESVTDYAVIDPKVPPFVVGTSVRSHLHLLGADTGEIQEETSYGDYHRVKCYADRFEVTVGPPQLLNYLPAEN